MFDSHSSVDLAIPSDPALASWAQAISHDSELEAQLQTLPVQRRQLQRKQTLFRAGQPCQSLFLVHAGFLKTCVLSEDGCEKITGFHLRGSLLGTESFGMPTYGCDVVALDTCEVWELPMARVLRTPELLAQVTNRLSGEVRSDWRWMLILGTHSAEQRVVAFILDLASRLEALGFSAHRLQLRMTRAEIGNFLGLQFETVTRVLSRLASSNLIAVDGREIRVNDADALRSILTAA